MTTADAIKPARPPAADDDLDRPLWGAAAIGACIGRTEAQAFRLLEASLIDATKVNRLWQSTRRRLRRSLGNEPTERTDKPPGP
jgi:hypothetical protein